MRKLNLTTIIQASGWLIETSKQLKVNIYKKLKKSTKIFRPESSRPDSTRIRAQAEKPKEVPVYYY